MKKENNFWVDNNGNKWDSYFYTEQNAIEHSKTMINCYECTDSSNCSYCINVSNCSYCINVSNSSNCRSCYDCINCFDCYDCKYTSYSKSCNNCRNISNCSYCRYCKNCYDCRYCFDYKSNPFRIISKKTGSRNSQTTVYFLNDNIQVVTGCFRGDLKKFEGAVLTTHADNVQHKNEYLEFIKIVKNYIEYLEK
jgi:hypothetical protein